MFIKYVYKKKYKFIYISLEHSDILSNFTNISSVTLYLVFDAKRNDLIVLYCFAYVINRVNDTTSCRILRKAISQYVPAFQKTESQYVIM